MYQNQGIIILFTSILPLDSRDDLRFTVAPIQTHQISRIQAHGKSLGVVLARRERGRPYASFANQSCSVERCVIRGPAGDDVNVLRGRNVREFRDRARFSDCLRATAETVVDGPRLFVELFEHVVVVPALLCTFRVRLTVSTDTSTVAPRSSVISTPLGRIVASRRSSKYITSSVYSRNTVRRSPRGSSRRPIRRRP